MPLADTIAAVSTPPGRGARAMVRLSGPEVREVLAAILADGPRPFDRGCFASRVRIGPGLPVLVSVFHAPASYTGQDSAEILLPGNPVLIEQLMGLLTSIPGVRAAGPGEFTARAYLNDRLSLDQAEGVAGVIAAQSSEELAAATDLLAGRTGAKYRVWAEELAMLLALVEAGIDFTDQDDVVPIAPAELGRRLGVLKSAVDTHRGGPAAGEADGHVAHVVLAGEPNAGKSTLFNALLGLERAVVSPIAGTTRDALKEPLDLSRDLPGAGPVLLIDLAGLDAVVAGAINREAQSAANETIARADVVVHCDPTGRFATLGTTKPVIRVRTKADQPWAVAGQTAGDVAVCALDGWNLAVLRRAIAECAWGSRGAGLSAILPRHRRALRETSDRIADAMVACEMDRVRLRDPELVAGSLRLALDALGELIGRISPDDVIGRIFATFCVGK